MTGFISSFASHRIAPNLLLLLMLASGLVVINRIDTRFFPKFEIQVIQISATWQGNSAEDVAESLIVPMENSLRDVPNLKKMTAVAARSIGQVYLEFPDQVDLNVAVEDVQRYLDLALDDLPDDSDAPKVKIIERPEQLLFLSLTGDSLAELRPLAHQIESELLRFSNIKVEINGLPDEIIEIKLNQRLLQDLNLKPEDIGEQIAANNIDTTAGNVGGSTNERILRATSKKEGVIDLANTTIVDSAGNSLRLGDIARIERKVDDEEHTIFFNGKPAVEFVVTKPLSGNALLVAEKIRNWREEFVKKLPSNIQLTAHREEWRLIESRLDLLLKNGFQGLILVLLLLFLFLHPRLAFWVAIGIPATFMISIAFLYGYGSSINMISMFAFIMTTGIIVDDSIVVGENSFYHYQTGKPPLVAATEGAKEMFPAVFASTFTTIASFMPLLLVGGPIGSILFVIPLVVICVLIAALFECFTVLPGHMAHAFENIEAQTKPPSRLRQKFEDGFNRFQEGTLRRLSTLSLRYRWVTITLGWTILVLSIALFIGGAVKFRFFPGADLNRTILNIEFVSGTPKQVVADYTNTLTEHLYESLDSFPEGQSLIQHISINLGKGIDEQNNTPGRGDEYASFYIEFVESENRSTRGRDIISKWNENPPRHPSLSKLSIREQRGGPPGEDLQIELSSDNLPQLKAASEQLQVQLQDIPGVDAPSDDMPYGKEQVIFELTPLGRSLNLSIGSIARQLRNAFDGYVAQRFYQGLDQVEVRVLIDAPQNVAEQLSSFQMQLPSGKYVLLEDIVNLKTEQGFDTIQRINRQPIINVVGEVDFNVTDVATIIGQLEAQILPDITQQYGVQYSFAGAQTDERETFADMQVGLLVSFVLIFIILAAVFVSWSLPFIILLTAPLGIIGAIWGHYIMGYEFTILSMFGIFTLNGIVINDSIILVRDYLARRAASENDHLSDDELLVESVCRRFRAIILTSLTTIFGLLPLMFETSTQSQFIIPMAISIGFGLAFATLLILFVMPAFVSVNNATIRLLSRPFKL